MAVQVDLAGAYCPARWKRAAENAGAAGCSRLAEGDWVIDLAVNKKTPPGTAGNWLRYHLQQK